MHIIKLCDREKHTFKKNFSDSLCSEITRTISFPIISKCKPFNIYRQSLQTHIPLVENRWLHLCKIETDMSQTQLRNTELNARMCDAMTRRSAKNKIWHLIGAFSSERKPAVVMDKEGDDTHKRNNTNRRHRQTSGITPWGSWKQSKPEKTKQRGGKVKQRRQVHKSATDKRSESHRSSGEEESSVVEKRNRGDKQVTNRV